MAYRVVVVGSGTRFLSGISVYTVRLADALSRAGIRTSLVTMRQLLPTRLYPGRGRVGSDLTHLQSATSVATFDGIDWFWLPSMIHAVRFIAHCRPNVIVLQWWTGTVLHSYLALAILARMIRAKVVIEFHEVLDTGEVSIPLWRTYAAWMSRAVFAMADAYCVHSIFDRDLMTSRWDPGARPVTVLPHGPHDHYLQTDSQDRSLPLRAAPVDALNVVFFGVIRPYKGLEDLIEAFEGIPEPEASGYWLTVVGETWEGWSLPAEMIRRSPRRDRITFVNRYVTDRELDATLRGADAVALPYRRSSLSGPLHVAMGYGLPIVMSDVGGNSEAAAGYGGVSLIPPGDVPALTQAIRALKTSSGHRYEHPRSWADTALAYRGLFDTLTGNGAREDQRQAPASDQTSRAIRRSAA